MSHRTTSLPFCFLVLLASAGTASKACAPVEAEQVKGARAILDPFHAKMAEPAARKLHIVYFTPKDREPAAEWESRVPRVMEHIRAFYAREMERLGFGPRSIVLDYDAEKKMVVHLLRGARPFAAYDTKSGAAIREEARPMLKAKGINVDDETILIFCNLTTVEGDSIQHNSPYYAGGTARSGTGWLCDSPWVDPLSLKKTEPRVKDAQYGVITMGRYNSIFVGGTAHELGHALGLPHNRANADQKGLGTSLMGNGNFTYGEELRKEGKGSFLPLVDGLRLASHPMFSGSVKDLRTAVKMRFVDLHFEPQAKSFRVTGRIESSLPCYAVVAYLDPAGGGDYDAHTACAVPDSAGRFVLECRDLVAGKAAELRLVACAVNGPTHQQAFPYRVNGDGRPDLDEIRLQSALAPLIAVWKTGDAEKFQRERARLVADLPEKDIVAVWAGKLAETIGKPPHAAPEKIPADVKEAFLSDCAAAKAEVGWLTPCRNHVPNDTFFLSVGHERFARGLYAHAPSRYEWQLGGGWGRLRGRAGMQDGNTGSVVFVVRGDGKEVWRSPVVKKDAVSFDVPIAGVRRLELIVEDAGDGRASDWGVWSSRR